MMFSTASCVIALATLSQLVFALPEPVPQITEPAVLPGPICRTQTVTKPFTKFIKTCPQIRCIAPQDCTETITATKTLGCFKCLAGTPTVTVTEKPHCPTCNTGCWTTATATAVTSGVCIYTNPLRPTDA